MNLIHLADLLLVFRKIIYDSSFCSAVVQAVTEH